MGRFIWWSVPQRYWDCCRESFRVRAGRFFVRGKIFLPDEGGIWIEMATFVPYGDAYSFK